MTRTVQFTFVSALLLWPAILSSQQHPQAPSAPLLSVGSFVGAGTGPSGSVAWGLEGMVPFSRYLSARAEYSRWGSGFEQCLQILPDSYACSVTGWAALAGIRLSTPLAEGITPYADLSGGRFTRSDIDGDPHGTAALSVGAGALVHLFGGLAARFGGSVLRPFDHAYEELMGERIEYVTGTIGGEYRIMH